MPPKTISFEPVVNFNIVGANWEPIICSYSLTGTSKAIEKVNNKKNSDEKIRRNIFHF